MNTIQPTSMNEEFPQTQAAAPSPYAASLESTDLVPTHIGRFRIEAILGKGGFGVVYLGHDEQLQRKVAVKVPRPQFVQRPDGSEAKLEKVGSS
jgi:serine/threonine protein kinase